MIAYGKKLRSMIGLCTNRNAITVPIVTAKASAISVTRNVTHNACSSDGASATKVVAIRLGDGTRYDGTPNVRQQASQPARNRTPTTSGGATSAIFLPPAERVMRPAASFLHLRSS